MLTFDEIRHAVGESSKLSLDGRQEEALVVLDRELAKAVSCRCGMAIRVLAMHASVLSESIGDLDAAKLYLEKVLSYEPGNPLALYGRAHILKKQGRTAEAKEVAQRLYSSVRASNTEETRGLEELLVCEWPEIGSGGIEDRHIF
jgi:tetratricopeptide (TPR) repeat protein